MEKNIPESFKTRIMWACHTYALVYHVLLGCGKNQEISSQAYGYAERITIRTLSDMAEVFRRTLSSDMFRKIEKAEALQDKFGRKPTARELYQNIRDVTVFEADKILKVMKPLKLSR